MVFSPEIEDPNNSKRDDDRGYAEAEYKPDVMPGYTLPSLPGWYYWALLRALGRTHDVLLLCVHFCSLIVQLPTTANVTDIDRVPHRFGNFTRQICEGVPGMT